MEITSILRKIIPIVIVICISIVCYVYFFDGYEFPPCCDTAITLIKAQEIAENWDFQTSMPINPSADTPLYTSVISTELPLHVLLAVLYTVIPTSVGDLTFAKIFFLILFLLPIVPLLLVLQKITRNMLIASVLVLFTYFSHWYGNMYWTGHVAQMLGIFVLLWMIYFLIQFESERKSYLIVSALVALALLFFIHVLTFLVGFITLLTFLTVYFIGVAHGKKKLIIALTYIVYIVVVLVFFYVVPEETRITPDFAITEQSVHSNILFKEIIPIVIIAIFFLYGLFEAFIQKKYVLIIFFFSIYLLTQSPSLDAPFYAYRFSEFIVIPFALLAGLGIHLFRTRLPQPAYINYVMICLLVIIMPLGIVTQNELRSCYIKNCPSLHPTQLPGSDLAAFDWLESNSPSESIIFAPPKFGYYIPIVANRGVEFPDGDKEQLFTSPDASARYEIARQYNISFIVWGGVIDEQGGVVVDMENYTDTPFNDREYFTLTYENAGTKIYALK